MKIIKQKLFDTLIQSLEALEIYAALYNNNINRVKQLTVSFLAGQLSRQLTDDKFTLVDQVSNLEKTTFSFDLGNFCQTFIAKIFKARPGFNFFRLAES